MFATIGPDDSDRRAALRWIAARAGSPPEGPGRLAGPGATEGLVGRPAIFLDRDDTICRCTNHAPGNDLGDPALVELLPGALQACQALAKAGFPLVAITNQGGVARGRYGPKQVDQTCERVNELLGGLLAAAYYCPYHPMGTMSPWIREHPWRKPQPGMILAAAEDLGLDLARSWTVGDKSRDCVAGLDAGTRAILVTGTVPGVPSTDDGTLDPAIPRALDLTEAAAIILEHARSSRP